MLASLASLSTLSTVWLALMTVCVPPPVLHHGPAQHTTYVYRFYGAWTDDEHACVQQSLEQWTQALQPTLDVRFVAGSRTDNPTLRLMKTRIPAPIGGAVVGRTWTVDGDLQSGSILYTDDPRRLSTCAGFATVTLHEVGHLLGLGHVAGTEQSIMRPSMDAQDGRGSRTPVTPTMCDVQQASRTLDPH